MAEKKAPKVATPEGYEDHDEFLKEARERFQEGSDFDRENRDAGLEDARFAAGEQWDQAAKDSRAGLPCLTINRLPQFIAQVVGDIRINRPSIRVRPAEDADKDLADVREGMIRAIERDCDAQGVYASAGQSQVTCGIGNFRVALKYAGEMAFERDIALERISDPFAVVWDPGSVEPTGRDAQWCFVYDNLPKKEFEARYPDAQSSDLVVPHGESPIWSPDGRVKVTEYWRVIDKPLTIAMLEDGSVVPADKVPEGIIPTATRKSSRKYACMYLITGNAILDGPFEWPIDRVPIMRVQGWEFNLGEKRVRFGLVRWAKDPQRLLNYWRSVAAQTLALAPKGKWLAHESVIPEDREEDFRTAATSADPLLIYGGNGASAPVYTPPPQMPAALLQEAALNSQDMKDVTGIQDASLGVKSNETSGKAILARERAGDVSTYIYHDNLVKAISEAGRVTNLLIPTIYDTARTIRIVGEDDSTKVQRINDGPNSVDINQGKYDVAVETGPSYSTKRVEAADSMMQFMQAVPAAGAVAPDLIAKAMDWPMADVLAERLKKTIPANLLEGEEGVEPKQPSPQEQQMMEMQAKAAQAEVDIKIANADEARADAAKAMFEAQKSELELAAMQVHAMNGDHTFGKQAEMDRQVQAKAAQAGQGQGASSPAPQAAPQMQMEALPPPQFEQGPPPPEQLATGADGQLNPFA